MCPRDVGRWRVRSVELLAGSLAPACLPVPPAGHGVCVTCLGAVEPSPAPSPTCAACRSVAVQLGRPLVRVTPVSLTTSASRLHRALCRYKSDRPDARLHARHLTALLGVFVANHAACVVPGGADAVLVVPSLGDRRPAPHPLHGVLAGVSTLPPVLDCLVRGPGTVGHRRASPVGLTCIRPLSGRRVLLVDDTYTSGAHLQSAAAAVTAAGAMVVGGLVAGRFVRGGTIGEVRLLQWARDRHWDPAWCARCVTRP
jgi:hypothetical protein